MSNLSTDAMNAILSLINSTKEASFEDKLNEHIELIKDSSKNSATINDAYGNSLLSVGTDDKVEKLSTYSLSNDTLNWPLWLALYNDSWVFQRAINKPAQDEIKCGISFIDDTDKSKLKKMMISYRNDLIDLLKWGALFGGAVAICMFDNFEDFDYARSLNKEKLKKSKRMRLYVVDRWYGLSPTYDNLVDNMASLDYGKPKYYTVTFPDGRSLKVHHDYVIRYEHMSAPKLVKAGMLQGWGYCEGSHILNELSKEEKLRASIQSLIDKSLIEVIKMAGMRGIFMGADKDNEEQIKKRLEMVNWGRNFNSLTFLDSTDEYQAHEMSGLGGFSSLLENSMWQIAAALEMQGVLYGDLKGGFTGDEKALQRYDEVIQGRCESYVRPVYDKLLRILAIMTDTNTDIDYTFNSLFVRSQEQQKMQDLQTFVTLEDNLLQSGIIDSELYAKALRKYLSNHIVDFGLTDKVIDKLSDDFQNQMENINIDGKEDDKTLQK